MPLPLIPIQISKQKRASGDGLSTFLTAVSTRFVTFRSEAGRNSNPVNRNANGRRHPNTPPQPVYNLSRMYSARLLDHFENPRNAGDVSHADATAEIENPACGDRLRLSLKVTPGGLIDIGFKAKGCVPTMACASAMTEMVAGKTLDDARRLQREELIAAVGGLPQASTHAAQLALDALSAALRQLKR